MPTQAQTNEAVCLKYLQQAKESDAGIELNFLGPDERNTMRRKLWETKIEHSPDYDHISFMQSGTTKLWLVPLGEEDGGGPIQTHDDVQEG